LLGERERDLRSAFGFVIDFAEEGAKRRIETHGVYTNEMRDLWRNVE
jgi:hypothetical protein